MTLKRFDALCASTLCATEIRGHDHGFFGTVSAAYATPTDIPGCELWLRADTGVSADANNRVSLWEDQSGEGHDVGQAVSANRPLSVAASSGVFGQPYINFDGVDNGVNFRCLSATSWSLAQPWTAFVVAKINAITVCGSILDGSTRGTGAIWTHSPEDPSYPIQLYAGSYGAYLDYTLYTWYTIQAYFNGASSQLYLNGTAGTAQTPGAGNPGGIWLGCNSALSGALSGGIAEVIVFNQVVSERNQKRLYNYFENRYNTDVAFNGAVVNYLLALTADVTSVYATTLTATTISAATISGTNAYVTTLTATTISGTTLSDTTVYATTITATTITATDISGTNIKATTLTGTTFSGTNVKATTVTATDLSGTNVYAATITASSISAVTISATTYENVPGAAGSGADPATAYAGSVLTATTITAATVSATTLSSTNLTATIISATNLTAVNISATTYQNIGTGGDIKADGTIPFVAEFSGTNSKFSGTVKAATVSATTVSATNVHATTVTATDLTGTSVAVTTVKATTLTGTTFSGTNAYATTVTATDLSGATLSGGNVFAAIVSATTISATTISATTYQNLIFTIGGGLVNSAGVGSGTWVLWSAPASCTVTHFHGYLNSGAGGSATVNARLSGSYNFLASNLSLTGQSSWVSAAAVQNTGVSAYNMVEMMIASVSGAPTQIAVQLSLSKP